MKLYQIVPYDKLTPRRRYHVRLPGHSDQHVGYFCDYHVTDVVPFFPFVEKAGEAACFRHVDRIRDFNLCKMYTVSYEYFDRRHVFKRCVYEEEQAIVCRIFFEKRVVNQIVSHLLGHVVVVY